MHKLSMPRTWWILPIVAIALAVHAMPLYLLWSRASLGVAGVLAALMLLKHFGILGSGSLALLRRRNPTPTSTPTLTAPAPIIDGHCEDRASLDNAFKESMNRQRGC